MKTFMDGFFMFFHILNNPIIGFLSGAVALTFLFFTALALMMIIGGGGGGYARKDDRKDSKH